MNPEEIFHAALAKPSTERSEFLAAACAGEEALQRRVEILLHAHENPGSFLADRPPMPGATLDEPLAERPGTVIGPYKLLEQIGEGGFGVVYMAEQTEPVRRKVALKILKPGMDTKQVIARFEAERQALAIMDHPNIAKVYDGGSTGEPSRVSDRIEDDASRRLTPLGSPRPYFVMELVKGVPITQFCDEQKLSPRQRLELFLPVCQAVQHAHQKGIIHRDLKPSNVLVSRHDSTPVPKIIDFGIAKALGQELTDKTLFTGIAQMVGTPLYMSPEQAGMSDLDVDTRSDIYSLGVLLYELLTGTTPFDKERFKQAAYDEIRRIIREEDPPKPSTRLSNLSSPHAPREEPRHVTRSVTATLASVAAQRQTEPAKLTKLVRGELDWIVMKALEKDRNRRYETANGFAIDVQRYLADEPVQACPPSVGYRLRKFVRRNRGRLATAGVLVTALLVVVGAIAGSVEWAARDRATRQAAVEKEAELALAEAERWQEQEKWPEALDCAKRGEGLLAGGGGQLRDRLRELRKDLEMRIRLEDVQSLVADLQTGWHEWDDAHDAYAAAFADYGIDVLKLPAGEAAALMRGRPRMAGPLAAALDVWACTVSAKTAKARPHLREVAGAADPDPWRGQVRAAVDRKAGESLAQLAAQPELPRQPRNSLIVLEYALRHCGRPQQALDVRRLTQRLYPADFWANYALAHDLFWLPNADFDAVALFARAAVSARPKSAGAHLLLALALQRGGKLDDAVSHHLEALDLAPDNPFAHHDYGWTLSLQKKYDAALAAYQKSIDLWPANDHAYRFRGHTLLEMKRPDEAIADYRKSIEINPAGANAHVAHTALGKTLFAQGKHDEAIDAYLRYAKLHPLVPNAGQPFCDAVRSAKPRDEAVAYFETVSDQNRDVYELQFHIAFALNQMGEHDRAVATYHRALEIVPNHAHVLHNLGAILSLQKKYDESLTYYDRAIASDPLDLWAFVVKGETLRSKGDLQAAADSFRRAIEVDANCADAHLLLAELLFDQGDGLNAFRSFREGLRLAPGRGGLGVEGFHSRLASISLRLALAADPKLRHPALAVEFAQQALRGKATADHWSTLGVAYYRAGSFSAAVGAFEQAMSLRKGGDGRDWFYLALAHHQMGDRAEAVADLRRALELDPKNATLHYRLGRVFGKMGKASEAREYLWKAIDLDPKDTIVRAKISKEILGARAALEKRESEESDPWQRRQHASEWFQLATAFNKLGMAAEAEAACRHALARFEKLAKDWQATIQFDDELGRACLQLAELLASASRTKEALALAQQALAHFRVVTRDRPDYFWNCLHAATSCRLYLERLGMVEEAAALEEEIVIARQTAERLQKLPHTADLLAQTQPLAQKRQWKEVAAVLRNGFEETKPCNPWLGHGVALARLLSGDIDGYVALVKMTPIRGMSNEWPHDVVRMRTLHPRGAGDPETLLAMAQAHHAWQSTGWSIQNLGLAYYRAGQYDKALERLEEATKLAPWYIYWPSLAMAHHQLGHAEEARRWLDKANAHRRQLLEANPLESATETYWQDWAYFELFLNEANALIDSGQGKPRRPR